MLPLALAAVASTALEGPKLPFLLLALLLLLPLGLASTPAGESLPLVAEPPSGGGLSPCWEAAWVCSELTPDWSVSSSSGNMGLAAP